MTQRQDLLDFPGAEALRAAGRVEAPRVWSAHSSHRTLDFGGATQYGKSWRRVVTVGASRQRRTEPG
jgi:hypothetical protein